VLCVLDSKDRKYLYLSATQEIQEATPGRQGDGKENDFSIALPGRALPSS
jgi:hypothetical protein